MSIDSIGKDRTLRAAQAALDGLSMRQKMISQNLANVDTPGYRAQSINFEDAVRAALRKEDGFSLAVTNPMHISLSGKTVGPAVVERPGGSLRADGNNVDIDVELVEMTETGIAYQALTQAASKKLALLKNIAMSR